MTIEENTGSKREELLIEAKAMGLQGAHFCKTEESLQAKIDKAKMGLNRVEKPEPVVETPKRKAPPKMSVANVGIDARAALLTRLEAEDPECKYQLQPFGITAEELTAKALQRTDHTIGNEIVCRTDREAYEAVVNAKNAMQRRSMDAIDPSGSKIKAHTARAKELPTAP